MADRVNSLLADLAHCSGDHSCELCNHCDNGNFMCIDNLAADAADVLQEYVDRCKSYADEIMALREKFRETFEAYASLCLENAKGDANMDYTKGCIDRELARIMGGAFQPWEVRYPEKVFGGK